MSLASAGDLLTELEQIGEQLAQLTKIQQEAVTCSNFSSPIEVLEFAYQREVQALNEVLDKLRRVSSCLKPDYSTLMAANFSRDERDMATRLLAQFIQDVFVEAVHTIDFTLELRNRCRLISSTENESVYCYLISVAGWDNNALDRENHSFGYHFHHVVTRGRVERTNVLLTFDPQEKLGAPDALYWEYHGSHKHADPLRWSRHRCIALHTAAKPSLLKPGKAQFKQPSDGASLLCAR